MKLWKKIEHWIVILIIAILVLSGPYLLIFGDPGPGSDEPAQQWRP